MVYKQKIKTHMESLNELGLKYGTDKSSLLHDYLKEYEKEFSSPELIESILEIGLQRGSKEWRNEHISPSLGMWGEFFTNAKLFGFDIKNLKFDNKRISFIRGDQGSLSDVVKLGEKIGMVDFILDDGSHINVHQLSTFLILWKNVKKGGVYVIEDCNAVVQKNLPNDERIQTLMVPFLDKSEMDWRYIESVSAGENSSLIIRKK